MRISEVTHERVKNIGNYESARVMLTAILDEGDDHEVALAYLKCEAYNFLNPKKEDTHDEAPDPTTPTNTDDVPY